MTTAQFLQRCFNCIKCAK